MGNPRNSLQQLFHSSGYFVRFMDAGKEGVQFYNSEDDAIKTIFLND